MIEENEKITKKEGYFKMNKKSLLMMMVTICLIAVVGVGATLAYLSDATNVMTNTFTVGSGIDVKQDETDVNNPNDRTEEGNDYTDILPGATLVKDPTVTVFGDSSDCYVFMELKGADALTAQEFTFEGFDANEWKKVSTPQGAVLDGVYCYKMVVAKSADDQKLAPLFTSVKYSIDAKELAEGVELSDVTIRTCAVQAANMTEATALDAAVAEFAK